MNIGYTKLWSSILTSSIWVEDDKTFKTFIGMLAMKDSEGNVYGTAPGLANVFHMTTEEFLAAEAKLSAPDPHSTTPDEQGRRIIKIPGGWRVVNHFQYRDKGSPALASRAEYMRKYRQKTSRPHPKQPALEQPAEGTISLDNSSLPAFNRFWEAYPKKTSRNDAEHAFCEVHAHEHIDAIITALAWQIAANDWRDTPERNQFIPYPATYLRTQRWLDQKPTPSQTPSTSTATQSPRAPLWAQAKACEAEINRLTEIYELDLHDGDNCVGETQEQHDKRMVVCKENRKQRRLLQEKIDSLNQRIANGES